MSALADAARDYLRLRNSLGHDLAEYHRELPRLVAFLEAEGLPTVTVAAALAWAQGPGVDPATSIAPRRMTIARGFARYLAGIDARTEVPPPGLIAGRHRWRPPFIYSPGDIEALMAQARQLTPMPAATHETLIGLLAATGMRVGEAIRLDRADIDWADARADDPGVEVRQDPHGARPGLHPHQPRPLRPHPQPALPAGRHGELLRLDGRHPADLRLRRAGVPAAARPRGNRGRRRSPAAHPRPAPHLRGPHPARAGIRPGRTSKPGCRSCRPIWAIATRARPTGTCRRHRNCWRWPPASSSGHRRRHADDLDRPHPAGLLHRAAGQPAPRQPPDHRLLPRFAQAAARLRPAANRQATHRPGLGRPRRRADHRVPRSPRNRPAQHHQDPQPAADRDPVAVHLRGTAPPRTRRAHPAGPGHPRQAVRQAAHLIPHPDRDRRPARRLRPDPMGRPPRPGAAAGGSANRAACLRADRAQLRRRHPRHRRQRPLPGQGPQTPRRPAHHPHPGGAARLDDRTRRTSPASRCSPPAPDDASAPTPSSAWSASTLPPPPSAARPSGRTSCTPTSCGTAAP